ncbi:A24 family peptidase [Synechococcus sp. HK01-R]|uniref:prepilin peptidase n=1 Tax=Synechococcus sp. HK01-R TaxID=2751171 RepID=UPI0016278664|nr:A24 family peptidase [Synechococcus sp. HK01-R]QNG26687.1 prepilin peptidase [Synechococcus sp. HK01-R]
MAAVVVVPLALLGACIGSFLNVVAWRLPRHESVVHPGSHCPSCGHSVRWHDNLPVLGWLWLAGRCRDCGWTIPTRYPLVEALSSGLWVSAAWARGLPVDQSRLGAEAAAGLSLVAGVVLVSLLLVLLLIDCDHLWLPEPLCRAGVLLGLIVMLSAPSQLLPHLLAAAAALLGMEALSALGEKILGQPALGLGDAKLAAMGGAWLGPAGIAAAMALAVCSGAIIGLMGRLSGRLGPRQPFPFGPFIALGIWLVWLTGPIWWWQNWIRLIGVA